MEDIQQTTAIAETTIAETTTIDDKLFEKTTVLEKIELGLFTGFEDATALEDKKSLTVFSAIVVVCCTSLLSKTFLQLPLVKVLNRGRDSIIYSNAI